MASNTDEKAAAYRDRFINLEKEAKQIAEARKDLLTEVKNAHLLKEEIAGIKIAVKRYFESEEKREFRESAESFADSLGVLEDTPLGKAAINREHSLHVS